MENSAFKALQSPLPIASLSPIPTTEEIVAEYGNIINIYLYKDLLTLEIYLKSNLKKKTVQFISLQEVGRLIPLLNAVPYDLTLTSKTRNDFVVSRGNVPSATPKRQHIATVSLAVQGCKGLRNLCSSDEKDSL